MAIYCSWSQISNFRAILALAMESRSLPLLQASGKQDTLTKGYLSSVIRTSEELARRGWTPRVDEIGWANPRSVNDTAALKCAGPTIVGIEPHRQFFGGTQ